MIRYVTGDIFTSPAQCYINPVNCVGVMGAGLALEYKRRYPPMFQTYKKLCDEGTLRIGQIGFYALKQRPGKIICLFPTKYHWRDKSTLDILNTSLRIFIKYAPRMKIDTLAMPKIGCGLGGLNFKLQVQPLIERHFEGTHYDVEIYV
jgi:O-acetyl-ADP-ribose deacetylase (regulator of RNase III)